MFFVLIDGLQDHWAQPGYSSMSHLGQSGPFAAINPQDRLVGSMYLLRSLNLSWVTELYITRHRQSVAQLWDFYLFIYFLLPFSVKKRQPLPLSPPSYPHPGSEVNGGFQSPYTPPINGSDGIMGK